jgi:uncharacterized protein YqfB (UPF0267 family)
MFEFLKKFFKKEQVQFEEPVPKIEYHYLYEFPELTEKIKVESSTFANKIYFENIQKTQLLSRILYETLYADQIKTIDPELTLEYTRWIDENKNHLTSKEFFVKFILSLTDSILCSSSSESQYMCDAIRFGMLTEEDVEKLKNVSIFNTLSSTFGTIDENKQIQQFMSVTNKKGTIVYSVYSDLVFEDFSESKKA